MLLSGSFALSKNAQILQKMRFLCSFSSSIGVQPHVQTLEQNESISVTMDEVDLNGPTRFCADKVMTPMQCEQLMTLAHVSCKSMLIYANSKELYHINKLCNCYCNTSNEK